MFYCDDSHHVAEELKKRVEPVSMWRLTEELELTEEKGTKLFAVLRKHEDKKKRRREKRKMLFRKLKSMSEKEETTVEMHRGKRVYKTLIKDLVANMKKEDIIYILGADETMLETVEPVYLRQYFTIIKEKKIKEKIIIKKGGKKLEGKYLEYKELDPQFLDETTVVVHQSRVFIFIWGNPYYLLAIKSKKFADTYRKQFDLLWKIIK